MAVLQPHQHRVTVERADLHEKIEKLARFLDTEAYYALHNDEQARMVRQLRHMNDYRDVLDERLAAFAAA